MSGPSSDDLAKLIDFDSLKGVFKDGPETDPRNEADPDADNQNLAKETVPETVTVASDPAATRLRQKMGLSENLPVDAGSRLIAKREEIALMLPGSLKKHLYEVDIIGVDSRGQLTFRFELKDYGRQSTWYVPNEKFFRVDPSDIPRRRPSAGPAHEVKLGTINVYNPYDMYPVQRFEEVGTRSSVIISEDSGSPSGIKADFQFSDLDALTELFSHLENLKVDPVEPDAKDETDLANGNERAALDYLRVNRRKPPGPRITPAEEEKTKVDRYSAINALILEDLRAEYDKAGVSLETYEDPEIFKRTIDADNSTVDVYLKIPSPDARGEDQAMRVRYSVSLDLCSILRVKRTNQSPLVPFAKVQEIMTGS